MNVYVSPPDLDTEVPSNSSRQRIRRVSLSQHLSSSLDDVQSFPYHGDNWSQLHVLHESREEGFG